MSRATSTVVDVTVFLLCVGAATAAVVSGVTVESPATENSATDERDLLATSTASVEYALNPPDDPPDWTTNATVRRQRTAHGTIAELLGEAAMSRVRIDGKRLSTAGTGFEAEVTNVTRDRLRKRGQKSAVRAHWEPYRDAPVNATIRVGERPPPATDVHAATLTVPSPMEPVEPDANDSESGYNGVATAVAEAVVDGLFPPEQAELALEGDYPSNQLLEHRYRRMGTLTDAGDLSVESNSTSEMNEQLSETLTETFESDMRDRFDSSSAAAGTVRTGEITITVRTWSA